MVFRTRTKRVRTETKAETKTKTKRKTTRNSSGNEIANRDFSVYLFILQLL